MRNKMFLLIVSCISLLVYKNTNAQEIIIEDSVKMPKTVEITKYIKTETLYDNFTKEIIDRKETELTEEMYNRLEYMSEPLAKCDGGVGCWETDYKKILLRVQGQTGPSDKGKVTLTTTWKKAPTIRSYDITAITFSKSINNISASLSSSIASNEKVKKDSYGAGISAKLTSGSISADSTIELTVSGSYSDMTVWQNVRICGTYQHAQSTVTLNNSTDYSFSKGSGGVGNVLNFNSTTIKDKYDQMQGVCFN